ncbi:hypothetical protein B0H14DRAFT_2377808 [Mycena olivaceomarginata]|nr:hypothetical protein B0H14DRAFT_2377808 [Mycena olivaceomarginata]
MLCRFAGILTAWLNLVLCMLSGYIGKKQSLEGITLYLKKHLYGNTVARDLWDGILAASGGFLCTYRHFDLNYMIGKDLVHLMNNWITKVCTVMCLA